MIDRLWDELREDRAYSTGIVRRRVAPYAVIDLFAAVEHPLGTPLLLVIVPSSVVPLHFRLPEAAGFSMAVHALAKDTLQIELRLLEPDAEMIFRSFVDAAIEGVSAAENEAAAFSALVLHVVAWQEFFRKHGAQGLSPAAQQGLIGELWVLRELLAPALSPGIAVDMWVGPTGANQDFEWSAYALEVKTSTSNALRSVRVNNLRQLDDTCLAALRILLVEAECHANGKETLPWAVEQTRTIIRTQSPDMLPRFNDLLANAGYLDRDAPRYSSIAYPVRCSRAFCVSDPFPRLTESTVPPGVGSVEYSVSLEALAPHEISVDSVRAELGALHGNLG